MAALWFSTLAPSQILGSGHDGSVDFIRSGRFVNTKNLCRWQQLIILTISAMVPGATFS